MPCVPYTWTVLSMDLLTIVMYGTTLIALMQILIEFQISFTVFSVCKFFSSFFRVFLLSHNNTCTDPYIEM